jgi:Alr-MurF fusion protein
LSKRYTSNAQLLISKSAILANIATYKSLIGNAKLLLMVKANGYGTDSILVSKAVEGLVDYLGAAYTSNALLLRESGITMPIMVMAPEPDDLEKIASNNLEPVLYSLEMIKAAIDINKALSVHIEIDSGMKRLGLTTPELKEAAVLVNNSKLNVLSIFSHLAGPSEMDHDNFTHTQAAYFEKCYTEFDKDLKSTPFKHLVSSGGIKNFPQYHFDMVRLGIGFYGFDPTHFMADQVLSMATLQSKILQIIDVKQGETIGYSRKGSLPYDAKIATLSIGYGDGYLRVFGNGNAEVLINGKRAKTVGNICMDLTMVDVTHIKCKSGDNVELFGANVNIEELANGADTIPYEILTNISPRVERILVG